MVNVMTRDYVSNYLDFALRVIFKPYIENNLEELKIIKWYSSCYTY